MKQEVNVGALGKVLEAIYIQDVGRQCRCKDLFYRGRRGGGGIG